MNARSSILLFSAIASLALGLLAVPARAQEQHTLQLAGVTSDGKLWHTIRYPNGGWAPFGDVEGQTGDGGFITDVAVRVIGAGPNGVLHLCAVNSDGRLWHTIRNPDGGWYPFGDVEGQAGERGRFVSVALANVNNELHLLGVTSDGRLWHTIRHANGTWEPFGDVKGQAGDPGAFTRVAATLIANYGDGAPALSVLGTTSGGLLFQTIRLADGRWSGFFHLDSNNRGAPNNFVDVDSTFTTSPAAIYIAGVLSDGRIIDEVDVYTMRTLFADVTREVGNHGPVVRVSIGRTADVTSLVHMAAVTADGGLWHTLGLPTFHLAGAPEGWLPFGDVKGQAGNPGSFVSVAVDGLYR
jgi:hypothetical protein